MKKSWLLLTTSALLLSGCLTTQQPYSGPINQLSGANVHYEPVSPESLQTYKVNGKQYKAIQNPIGYMNQGTAAIFDEQSPTLTTLSGESFNQSDFVGAHSGLPLPSYVTVTNMNNGRQTVVRLIARAPEQNGSIITVSRMVAERLLLTEKTPIQIDYVNVLPDGQVEGIQAELIEATRQNHPLPERPNL